MQMQRAWSSRPGFFKLGWYDVGAEERLLNRSSSTTPSFLCDSIESVFSENRLFYQDRSTRQDAEIWRCQIFIMLWNSFKSRNNWSRYTRLFLRRGTLGSRVYNFCDEGNLIDRGEDVEKAVVYIFYLDTRLQETCLRIHGIYRKTWDSVGRFYTLTSWESIFPRRNVDWVALFIAISKNSILHVSWKCHT